MITTKKGKGKFPLFRGNGEHVIPIYAVYMFTLINYVINPYIVVITFSYILGSIYIGEKVINFLLINNIHHR